MATDAMIDSLTGVVFTALKNEVQFALEFKDQLETMKSKLQLMTAFLSSTENPKTRGEVLQKMLPNLRKLIYEADDILTDCQIRDDYRTNESACSTFTLDDLFFLPRIGRRLNNINSRIQKMETELRVYLIPDLTITRGRNVPQLIRYSSQDYDPSEIIGLETDMEKIKGWVFGGNEELRQVGIVGMGGLGKTTLAQKIFNDRDVVARFEKMIWVPVSQDFSEERLMTVMLKQLGKDGSRSDRSSLLRQIHEILRENKCLIVMDDVWTMNVDWWEKLCSKTTVVIITSRNEDVIRNMGVDDSRIHRPRLLDEEESWSLFCKFAFPKSRGQCPTNQFRLVGREILEKCGGLPLAIKTVAALLAPKSDSISEWKKISQDFHELTTKGQNSSVTASLQLSYDELPALLKQCLLCFSIYPEDVKIHAEQIVLWWVGEGLIQGNDTRTATELGYEYLSELASRCLIEVVNRRGYDGRIYSCKMHDLVRDMIIKVARDEAFCSFDNKGKQTLIEDSRWLGFTEGMDPKSLQKSPKLRALLLMSSDRPSFGRNVVLLRSLRVLDFSNYKLDPSKAADLWNWICFLKRLAHLNLSGVVGLQEVPYSIKRLRNLQILVLRNCKNLMKLPTSITDLKKLIILDLKSCNQLDLPNGLDKLVHLQVISGFKVMSQANPKSCQFLQLQKLRNLRFLRMNITTSSEISENERNVLSNLQELKVLAIDAEMCKDKSVLKMFDELSPPPNLEELYIENYHHKILPKWINPRQLSSLQYLCLEDGDAEQLPMGLQDEYEDSNGSKWNLEGLRLMFMPNLDLDCQNLDKDMPCLRYAEVSHCFNVKNFPSTVDKTVWRKN